MHRGGRNSNNNAGLVTNAILCLLLALLTSSNAIVQNLAKDPETNTYLFDPTSMPFMSEILKLIIAKAAVALQKEKPKSGSLPGGAKVSPLESTYFSVIYLLPSLLYFFKSIR